MVVSVSCLERLQKMVGMTLVVSLLAALYLNLIIGIALAGTETGEFCPTCPDWTNLDGWLVKKEAYEKAQGNGQPAGSQSAQTNSNQAASLKVKVDPSAKGYPENELLTRASLIKRDQVILDVRDNQGYLAGHIPGARSLYWKDMQKGGRLDPGSAKEALDRAGVNSSDRLLVYGEPDAGDAFVFWALKYLGQENVSLLDGGADAAWGAGIPKENSVTLFPQSNYTIRTVPWLLVTSDNFEGFLAQSDVQILDARDYSDYGMNMLTNSSTSLTAEMLYEDSRIKDPATLEDLLSRRSLDVRGTQIVYGTPQAYKLFFSLKLMGYNATLLEGDWWMKTKWAASSVR